MLHRRSTAIAAGILLLAAPVISSCSPYQTNQVNTISTGVSDRSGEIDVLGAVIVADHDNAGLFVGSLANNSTTTPDTLTAVGGTVGLAGALKPLLVPAAGNADLFDVGGISVTGDFKAGNFVSVRLEFESGQKTTLSVPVVKPCYQYDPAKFDPPLVLPSPKAEPAEAPPVASEGAGASQNAEPDLYSCEIETRDEPTVEGGGTAE